MPSKRELTGQVFGRLTVIGSATASDGRRAWQCRCECGNERIVVTGNLTSGHTQSCGCLHREQSGSHLRTHGLSRSRGQVNRLHIIWSGMRQRCNNPQHPAYDRYGGRGITTCLEWESFEAFHAWAKANGYAAGLEVDRINNDEGYSPSNCRWVTPLENNRNRRTTRKLTHNGVTKTLKEWADELGIHISSLVDRLEAGWSTEEALTRPKSH